MALACFTCLLANSCKLYVTIQPTRGSSGRGSVTLSPGAQLWTHFPYLHEYWLICVYLRLQHVWSESEDCLPFLQLAQDYISSCGKKTLLEVLEKVFTSFRPVRKKQMSNALGSHSFLSNTLHQPQRCDLCLLCLLQTWYILFPLARTKHAELHPRTQIFSDCSCLLDVILKCWLAALDSLCIKLFLVKRNRVEWKQETRTYHKQL